MKKVNREIGRCKSNSRVSNECLYAKILGKRDLMKLGAMCCHADIINYGSLPYTDFIRTRTLCQGGDFCDFRFVRHKTDAGDGWERSKSI